MHPIIALWSHPRSMSTATERIMRERGDLVCFHEPFMYDYYVHRKVRQMPHFNVEQGHPQTYAEVREMLLEQAQKSPVFFKDMSYYVMPHILSDMQFSESLVNCFLIRNPVATIASYFRLDPDVTCEEIGLEAQCRHYEALAVTSQIQTVVIQAEDIRNNPRSLLRTLWASIGLTDAEHALRWRNESPKDWQQVEGWHGEVMNSTGIRPLGATELDQQTHEFEQMSNRYPRMLDYLEHHLPYYETLKAQAIQPCATP